MMSLPQRIYVGILFKKKTVTKICMDKGQVSLISEWMIMVTKIVSSNFVADMMNSPVFIASFDMMLMNFSKGFSPVKYA